MTNDEQRAQEKFVSDTIALLATAVARVRQMAIDMDVADPVEKHGTTSGIEFRALARNIEADQRRIENMAALYRQWSEAK